MIPVVKIKAGKGEGQGGYLIINQADFDPAKHQLYVELPEVPEDAGADQVKAAKAAVERVVADVKAAAQELADANAAAAQAEAAAAVQRQADAVQRRTRKGLSVS